MAVAQHTDTRGRLSAPHAVKTSFPENDARRSARKGRSHERQRLGPTPHSIPVAREVKNPLAIGAGSRGAAVLRSANDELRAPAVQTLFENFPLPVSVGMEEHALAVGCPCRGQVVPII